MTPKDPSLMTDLMRERLAFKYSRALERGDLDALQQILEAAHADARLDQMILEIDEVYQAEFEKMQMPLTRIERNGPQKEEKSTNMIAMPRPQTRSLSPTLIAAVVAVALGLFAVLTFQTTQYSPFTPGASANALGTFPPSPTSLYSGPCRTVTTGSANFLIFFRPEFPFGLPAHVDAGIEIVVVTRTHSTDGTEWLFIAWQRDSARVGGWVHAGAVPLAQQCDPLPTPTRNPDVTSTPQFTPPPSGTPRATGTRPVTIVPSGTVPPPTQPATVVPPTFPATHVPPTYPATHVPPTYPPTHVPPTYPPTFPPPTQPATIVPPTFPATHVPPTYPPTHVPPTYPPTFPPPTFVPPTQPPTFIPPTHIPPTFPPTFAPPTQPPTHIPPTFPATFAPPTQPPTFAPPTQPPTQVP